MTAPCLSFAASPGCHSLCPFVVLTAADLPQSDDCGGLVNCTRPQQPWIIFHLCYFYVRGKEECEALALNRF